MLVSRSINVFLCIRGISGTHFWNGILTLTQTMRWLAAQLWRLIGSSYQDDPAMVLCWPRKCVCYARMCWKPVGKCYATVSNWSIYTRKIKSNLFWSNGHDQHYWIILNRFIAQQLIGTYVWVLSKQHFFLLQCTPWCNIQPVPFNLYSFPILVLRSLRTLEEKSGSVSNASTLKEVGETFFIL